MIIDKLKNGYNYKSISPLFEKAVSYLINLDPNIEKGRHDIEGNDLFALIIEGEGLGTEDSVTEAHDKYLDFHFIIKGKDGILFGERNEFTANMKYNSDSDYTLFDGKPTNSFVLNEGEIALFYPNEIHSTSQLKGVSFKKAVVKIKI